MGRGAATKDARRLGGDGLALRDKYAEVYYDPSHSASFGGLSRLWQEVGGSRKAAEEWLKSQDAYTLHRPARRKVKRNRIQVAGLDDQWESDLVDVQSIAKYNNNYRFLMTCVDTLSKYAFVIPLKNKTGDSIVTAFTKIFKERQPRKLRTDSGKEYLNKKVQQFLKSRGIIFFTSNNDTKCAVVERFNRTLRAKMWRYFTATKKERYIDVLQRIVDGYNGATHRTTGRAPDTINDLNGEDVWRKMYGYSERRKAPKYKVGDLVRINKAKGTFEKGYRTNWTRELFQVVRVYKRRQPEYKLEDLNGQDITGNFVEGELQGIEREAFKIKKVIKRGGKESLVSWRGYPHRTWIPTATIRQYK